MKAVRAMFPSFIIKHSESGTPMAGADTLTEALRVRDHLERTERVAFHVVQCDEVALPTIVESVVA